MNDINEVNTAYTLFVQTYNAIPGDFDKAADFWSGNNGDGDNRIEMFRGRSANNTAGDDVSNVFVHLTLSKILSGSYSARIDEASYAKKTPLSGYMILTNESDNQATPVSHTGFITALSQKNVILIGKTLASGDRDDQFGHPGVTDAFLTPDGLYKIDKKLDDGLSTSGRVSYRTEAHANVPGNVTAATCINGTSYLLTSSAIGCNLVYELSDLKF